MYATGKIGPKGQVVIPKPLRDEFGFQPGALVDFHREGRSLRVERKLADPIAVFERIAKSGKRVSAKDIDMDAMYEEQIMGRWKRVHRL